jgi:hypothetical protein
MTDLATCHVTLFGCTSPARRHLQGNGTLTGPFLPSGVGGLYTRNQKGVNEGLRTLDAVAGLSRQARGSCQWRGKFNESVTPSFYCKRDCTPISYHWSTIISSTLHCILTKIISTPSMPILENAQNTDARWATFSNDNQVVITNNYDTSNAGAKQCYSLRFCT